MKMVQSDPTVNIWDENDMANMSHGLWGPYELNKGELRFDNGFFDYERVYYDVNLSDDNHTIAYVGPMLGGNYQDLFGNWLPSIWEPKGIFFDEDQNPATDNILQAFLGVAPGFTERAWYKRTVVYNPATPNIAPVYTWSEATDEDMATWSGEWYNEGPIEDVLNLGLNYIINIGENAKIGETFTLRITPHVDTNQTPPSSYRENPGTVEGTGMFNSDSNADILWVNSETGDVTIWYMDDNGTHVSSVIGDVTSDFSVQGTGDFNSDGIDDILWRNMTTNEISIWFMNVNGTYTPTIINTTSSAWNIESTADFDGNGASDILWRSTSNQIGITYLDPHGSFLKFEIINTTSSAWNIESTADFDGNGASDILWRSTGNKIGITYLDTDGSFLKFEIINTTSSAWNIESTADFDGNGAPDIYGEVQANKIGITYLDTDGSYLKFEIINTTSSAWNIESTADFDGNTASDILWRSTANQIGITSMDVGGAVLGFKIIAIVEGL